MMRIRHICAWWCVLILAVSAPIVRADDIFNPDNPPEPMLQSSVSISAEPAEGASSISAGGSFSMGRTLSISVTPKSGYAFSHWTLNGVRYSTAQSFNYTVGDSSAVFVAYLRKHQTVTVNVSPSGAGSVTGGGTYAPGTRRQIRVTRTNTGYTFLHWTLNGVQYSTAQSFYYTIGDSSVVFTAVFRNNSAPPEPDEPDPDEPFNPDNPPEPMMQSHLSVSTNLPDGVVPSTITSGGSYPIGKQVSITTTVPNGFVFLYWMLNGQQYSTSQSCTYTMTDADADFVAMFVQKHTVTLSITPANAGTVSGGGTFTEGTNRTIRVTPATGYIFDYWLRDNARYSAATSFSYTVEQNDVSFVAVCHKMTAMDTTTFNPDNPPEPLTDEVALNITATANDTLRGTVTGLPDYPLSEGDRITLTATVRDDCYQFVGWSDNVMDNPRQITLTTSATYVAVFEPKKFTITTVSHNIDTDTETGGSTDVYY